MFFVYENKLGDRKNKCLSKSEINPMNFEKMQNDIDTKQMSLYVSPRCLEQYIVHKTHSFQTQVIYLLVHCIEIYNRISS